MPNYRCCQCKKSKIRIACESKTLFYSNGLPKLYYIDSKGARWQGSSICPDCIKINQLKNRKPKSKYKKRTSNIQLNVLLPTTCKSCNLIKLRAGVKTLTQRYQYKDEFNRSWHGKVCPDCTKVMFANLRKTKKKPKKCIVCQKEFIAGAQNITCSKECRTKRRKDKESIRLKNRPKIVRSCKTCNKNINGHPSGTRYCSNECKPKPKRKKRNRQVFTKACVKCNKEFTTKTHNRLYCKPSHSPSNIKHRKRYKGYKRFKQLISKSFKKEIQSFYDNKPNGYEVDHIIPRNHPDVSGLHVPWNLQYLTKNDNNLKNNKFDFTYDNNTWKKLKS